MDRAYPEEEWREQWTEGRREGGEDWDFWMMFSVVFKAQAWNRRERGQGWCLGPTTQQNTAWWLLFTAISLLMPRIFGTLFTPHVSLSARSGFAVIWWNLRLRLCLGLEKICTVFINKRVLCFGRQYCHHREVYSSIVCSRNIASLKATQEYRITYY